MTNKCTTLNTTDTALASQTSEQADIKTLVNDIRSKLKGDYNVSKPGLAIGTTKPNVSNAAFDYQIGGVQYSKAAVAAGTAPGSDVIPTGKYGAVAFDIGTNGTIDAISATGQTAGTFTTAATAIAALADPAADHARMGYVTASKSDGAFTFGTTNLDAANTTVAYTDSDTAFEAIGSAVS